MVDNYTFDRLNEELADEKFFVVDKKVYELYRDKLPFLNERYLYLLDDPEGSKNLAGYEKLTEYLLRQKISRKDRLVVIGGGATGDLAGFAAATVLRGVDWLCVPTTLLSIVDSSIGGKTGINTGHGKNLLGAFHSPRKTLVALDFLASLDSRELDSGKGEILKYAFLDPRVFHAISDCVPDAEVIQLCRRVKEEIVEQDFKESGLRAKLNLGHTFGHAIESMTGLPHGVAVALGLEIMIDLFSPELRENFKSIRDKLGLSQKMPNDLDAFKFWELISLDKKRKDGEITMVVPVGNGESKLQTMDMKNLKLKLEASAKYQSLLK